MAGSSRPQIDLPGGLPELPAAWRYEALADLMTEDRGISYGVVQPGKETGDGIPIARVNDIRNGRINTSAPLKVTEEIEAKYHRTRLRGGEVLLTLVGTVGESAIVPHGLAGWNIARAVAVLPVNAEIGPLWVHLCLRSRHIQHLIRIWCTTTVQATFNLRDVVRLPIPVPPKREREAIAHILGTLDDKIELNRRMNETLEAMARALFKSWFVDFDPVRAKLEGRQPAGMDKATAALFPDSFQDSPLGGIPKGWNVGRVKDHFHLTMGQSPPGSTYNETGEGLPFFQGRRDFGFRFPSRRVYCTEPTRFAEAGDTLVSVRAPVGDLNMAIERCCIGRGVASVRHNTESRSYTYYAMHSLSEDFARYEAEGTVFGCINKESFEALELPMAGDSVIHAFERILNPCDQMIEALTQQTDQLAALRDALLPKLLSGEIRVAPFSSTGAGPKSAIWLQELDKKCP